MPVSATDTTPDIILYVVWLYYPFNRRPRHFCLRQQPQALPVGSIDNPVDRADTSPVGGPILCQPDKTGAP